MAFSIIDILGRHYKGREYSCGETYESLVIHDGGEKPSLEELMAKELDTKRLIVKERVHQVAYTKIITVMPDWKQRNALARRLELTAKTELTVDEQLEAATLDGIWTWIKAVRDYSNALEATIDASTDPYAEDINAGWPVYSV